MALERAILEHPEGKPGSAFDHFLEHYFAPHVYGRRLFIPKGMFGVGKIHNHAHLNILLRGVVKVVTEFGEDVYTGPRVWVSEPGTKRSVFALEDTEWMTIHPNFENTQDLAALEDYVIAKSFEDFDRLQLEREAV
jgi:hypothetical protein